MRSEIITRAVTYTENWFQWLEDNPGRLNGVVSGVVEATVHPIAFLGATFEHAAMVVAHVAGTVISVVGWACSQPWCKTCSLPQAWLHLNGVIDRAFTACVQIPLLVFNVPAIIIFRLWDPTFQWHEQMPQLEELPPVTVEPQSASVTPSSPVKSDPNTRRYKVRDTIYTVTVSEKTHADQFFKFLNQLTPFKTPAK